MKRKILVIEDNEQNLYLMRYILEDCDYEVFSAEDGKEGIELAGSVLPDLILLDIQLPIMNGYTVARHLRENPDLADTPIVAVTSYAMPGDKEKAMEAGCSGYIEKPIDLDTFDKQVEKYLSLKRQDRGEPC
jgi:two-component system cell cycle response regulator DivK